MLRTDGGAVKLLNRLTPVSQDFPRELILGERIDLIRREIPQDLRRRDIKNAHHTAVFVLKDESVSCTVMQ